MDLTQIVVALVGTAGLVVTGFLTYWAARDKTRFDKWTSLQDEIDRLREHLAERDAQAIEGHEAMMLLRRQVIELTDLLAAKEREITGLQVKVSVMDAAIAKLEANQKDLGT